MSIPGADCPHMAGCWEHKSYFFNLYFLFLFSPTASTSSILERITLVLDGLKQGNYIVHYYAYPREITIETADDYELGLDPEVAALLPVYIASELYEDDDSNMAYYFREQYMEAKQKLVPTIPRGKASYIDNWGWD